MVRTRYQPHDPAPDTPPGRRGRGRTNDLLELWFALDRREWSSLVLVPAGPDGSVDDLAKALAEAGQALSEEPVSALTSDVLGPTSVRALAALVAEVRRRRAVWRSPAPPGTRRLAPPLSVERWPAGGGGPGDDEAQREPADPPGDAIGVDALRELVGPVGRLIVAIPPVLAVPLGIAVARAADAVVLGVELGRTGVADTARTVEAIGREHVVGACVMRPKR